MNARFLRKRVFSAACSFSLVGLLNAAPPPNTGKIRLITKETSLGKVPLMADLKQLALSTDNLHVAFPVMREGQWTVWRDGVERGQYRAVRLLRFSPNGRRLAYVGARGGYWEEKSRLDPIGEEMLREAKSVVVVDEQESPEYELLGDGSLGFSPDSQRLAYAVIRDGKWRVVVDGREGGQALRHGRRRSLLQS